jgi:Rab GDP dissociation inhibitor
VSTEAETDKPEIELKPGMDLLGPVEETFFDIYDRYEPINNPEEDSCFLTNVRNAATALIDCAHKC